MNCPKCGAAIAPGSAFCAACGMSVTDPGAATVVVATAEEGDQLLAQLRRDLAKDYEVEKELGRGGMAVVYKAREIELRRLVALKVLPPGMGSADLAERFRREARMAAALDHPNIIPIHRVGQAAGTYFFAMKFVEGRAVDAIIESQGALPVPVVLQILRAAAGALAFAHERQIVHRDIKGANIMVDQGGRILVADFGIARAAEEKTLTASGSVIGTPHFMSPEQCSGQKVGPQSDQYSLGVLAFQMLTGQVPFDADSVITIIQHHYFTPVPDIAAVREGVPEELLAVVYRALAKDAGQRYGTTREMADALEAVPCSAEEKAQAEAALRELARGETIPKVRTDSLPPLADARTMAATAIGTGAPSVSGAVRVRTPASQASGRRRSRAPLLAGAAAVVIVGAVGGWLLLRSPGAAPAGPTSAAPDTQTEAARLAAAPGPVAGARRDSAAPPAVTPRQNAAEEKKAEQLPARGQERAVAPRPTAPAPAAPAQPTGTALLRVRTVPPNAQIFVDDQKIGDGAAIDVEIRAGARHLRISAPGFVTFDTTLNVQADKNVILGTKTLKSEGGP